MRHNAKWTVSLSNGETLFEGKGDYTWIDKELSPWLRLMKHISDNNLRITSLALYTDDNRRFNLPASGNNPNFTAFMNAEKPIGYNCFRSVSTIGIGCSKQIHSHYSVIEAIYKTYKLQLWVDEYNPLVCWVLSCQL